MAADLPSTELQTSGERLANGVWARSGDLRFAFSRSSGPGGQAVNKLSTRAELRIAIAAIRGLHPDAAVRLRQLAGSRITKDDELVITASTYRSQLDNKLACIERLKSLVARAIVRPKVRRPTKPSRAKNQKRLASKRKASEKKSLRRRTPDRD